MSAAVARTASADLTPIDFELIMSEAADQAALLEVPDRSADPAVRNRVTNGQLGCGGAFSG